MSDNSVLEIIAYGAWNGGTYVDNSMYEKTGLTFKGGIRLEQMNVLASQRCRTCWKPRASTHPGSKWLSVPQMSETINTTRVR